MQLGNPTGATADASNHTHYLIQRAQYAMDYNDTRRQANWVSWDLTSADSGSSGRSNFAVDYTLPAGFALVDTTAYSGTGFDRGHMCPSGDRTITTADNQVTFYMSNMVPQAPDNNQGVWASLESYCRSLAGAGNEILIISGPAKFSGSVLPSGVSVPGSVWKIAVVVPAGGGSAVSRITSSTRVIAVDIPNVNGIRTDPWENYVTSAAAIEDLTGFTFFSALDPSLADSLRSKMDGQTQTNPPGIAFSPTSRTVSVGDSVVFTVVATGSGPFIYQWQKEGEPVGDNATKLTIASATADDAGVYIVKVSNDGGYVLSNPFSLTVTQSFAAWAQSYGLVGGAADADADPDGDGRPNLLEYALGTLPDRGGDGPVLESSFTDGHLIVRFKRPRTVVGVNYEVQVSTNLSGWSSIGAPVVESSTATEDTLVAEVPADGSSEFVRLVVSD